MTDVGGPTTSTNKDVLSFSSVRAPKTKRLVPSKRVDNSISDLSISDMTELKENGDVENSRRTFVIQVYLNDDFDGGETEFLYQNKREKASAGDVLIFPCQYTHVHRGNPPINGDKYLVTSWAWIQSEDQ